MITKGDIVARLSCKKKEKKKKRGKKIALLFAALLLVDLCLQHEQIFGLYGASGSPAWPRGCAKNDKIKTFR